jgi:hypothetical protein
VSDDQNKLAYSGAQDLSISPDGAIGTPALQGSLSDPSTSANIFFSEDSEDSSEPAERESGRENFFSFADEYPSQSIEKKSAHLCEILSHFHLPYKHKYLKLLNSCSGICLAL